MVEEALLVDSVEDAVDGEWVFAGLLLVFVGEFLLGAASVEGGVVGNEGEVESEVLQ